MKRKPGWALPTTIALPITIGDRTAKRLYHMAQGRALRCRRIAYTGPCCLTAFAFLLFTATFTGCGPSSLSASKNNAAHSAENSTTAASVVRVTVVKPERKTIHRLTTQPGRIEAFERTPIYAKIDGYVLKQRTVFEEKNPPVEKELVDIGDEVQDREVLAQLWVPELNDELRQKELLITQAEKEKEQAVQAVVVAEKVKEIAVAGIQRAEGDYERWKSEHERIKTLAASGSVTQKLVDETLNQMRSADAARTQAQARLGEGQAGVAKAKADQAAADARLKVAQATRDRVKTLVQYTNIRAPFAGVVTERNIDTGHFVRPAQGSDARPLFVVVRTDKMRIFVDVPELDASLVDEEDPATIHVQALGKTLLGAVTRTSFALDPVARTLRVQIDVPNDDGRLRPGMYATVEIRLAESTDVLTLPASAIVTNDHQEYCCCVRAGKIVHNQVTLGLRSGNDVEVRSGLNGNEWIVLANSASLQTGQTVEVVK